MAVGRGEVEIACVSSRRGRGFVNFQFSILNFQFNSVLPRLGKCRGGWHLPLGFCILYLLVAKGTQNHCDAFRRGAVVSLAKTNAPQRAVPTALLCFLTPPTPHAYFRLQCCRRIGCGLWPYRPLRPVGAPLLTQERSCCDAKLW